MADRVVDKASFQPAYSSYYGSLPSEAKERYQKKLQYASNAKSLPDPYSLTEKWSTDPSTWPDLTFGDIYMYLIDTPSIFTKDSMKAYKSLDAYNYVVSGHVQVVLSHLISDDCPFIALKTKVTPSQRNRDKPHQPWVYLDNSSNSKTWCLCAEPEYGRMIKCNNNECPYQWFHYKCVNIRRKPKGKWYCLNCEE